LLIVRPYVWAVIFVAFIGLVVATKFTIADLRILDSLEQFGSQKITWVMLPHCRGITFICQKFIDNLIVEQIYALKKMKKVPLNANANFMAPDLKM
jgi:hypothetical protein